MNYVNYELSSLSGRRTCCCWRKQVLKFFDKQDDIKILTEWVHPEAGEDHRDRGRGDGGGQVRQEHLLDGVHVRHAARLRYGRHRGGSELYGVEWFYFLIPLSSLPSRLCAACSVLSSGDSSVPRPPVSCQPRVSRPHWRGRGGLGGRRRSDGQLPPRLNQPEHKQERLPGEPRRVLRRREDSEYKYKIRWGREGEEAAVSDE